ncbi:hypothetical protein CASFOL_003336 [Castilleja foliolosa]|uniref:K Homology domain-containing protein n=1 Tax=Castilleja foliolosa TaxID=1961234 RepID=A0ABD3EGV3_9LAMI
MDRSRSKRSYYDQDYESETLRSRSKPRYGNSSYGGGSGGGGHHYPPSYHRRSSSSSYGGGGRKMQDNGLTVTTSYRILCHSVKAGAVIGKSGSIIKAMRQQTGAWINVHELAPGDKERVIEISDTQQLDPDERMPSFSPAQEALFLIHDRILETEMGGPNRHGEEFGDDENEEYGNDSRVVTRLVVSKMNVGSLMGKGGKIIKQMRMETKTHIRVLTRDQKLPRCVSTSEEIVEVVGDMNAVKSAVEIISSRLRESQHRNRNNFNNNSNNSNNRNNRQHSPDGFYSADDDFHVNRKRRRPSLEGPSYGSRYSDGSGSNNYSSRSSGHAIDSGTTTVADNAHDLVFRILCPVDKLYSVVGESDGIVDMLQNDIGVNVEVTDPVAGSDEHIIIISSDEGPDDELFPAQEALLHIQTRIVDLVPEKGNIITTRLLLQSDEIGSLLEQEKIGGANVKILPKEALPLGFAELDEIVQIVGEIKAARKAVMEVTSRVRSYIYREFLERGGTLDPEAPSRINETPSSEIQAGNGPVVSNPQSSSAAAVPQEAKGVGPPNVETVNQNESELREDQPTSLNRISMPLVTRSTLEVVIPPYAASELAKKSRKLALISELSGANVKLIDDRPDEEKIIQISGTPEQAARAQSLLQGFIFSKPKKMALNSVLDGVVHCSA